MNEGAPNKFRRSPSSRAPLVIAALLLVVTALAWPFFKCHLQAIAALDLVAGQPVPHILQALVTEPVTSSEVTIATSVGPIRARLYTPTRHPHAPALVILHGVHHLGMDEPRLIAFAAAISSCGLRVLTPELPDIKDYHVGINSIAAIGDSARWLSHQDRDRPVGVVGLSFSGGLSLLAAADPAYHSAIKFVLAVGAQNDLRRVANYYRTGTDTLPDGTLETLPPHEYGALVLEYQNLQDFLPAPDIEPLRAVLRAHLCEDPAAEKLALANLTPQQKSEAAQLMNSASLTTKSSLANSDAQHIDGMAAVSPHGHLATLTTPVYLLHGEGDNIIPYAETLWTASELPSRSLQAELISPVISHLDMDGHNPSALDRTKLVHFFALVFRAAESR